MQNISKVYYLFSLLRFKINIVILSMTIFVKSNSVEPNQIPHLVTFCLDLYFLPKYLSNYSVQRVTMARFVILIICHYNQIQSAAFKAPHYYIFYVRSLTLSV